MPADQRARLRRLHVGRADHQHDRGRERNDGERIVRGDRKPLHDADRDRAAEARHRAGHDVAGDRCVRVALRTVRRQSRCIRCTAQKKRGGRSLCRPRNRRTEMSLLQVGQRGQVSRQLDDAGRAAPVANRRPPGLIAVRIVGPVEVGGREVGGEGVTGALRQVGVGVADVQREHLVGEADADVPGVVARLGMPFGKCPAQCRRRRRSAEPLPAEFTRHVHADAAAPNRWSRAQSTCR